MSKCKTLKTCYPHNRLYMVNHTKQHFSSSYLDFIPGFTSTTLSET